MFTATIKSKTFWQGDFKVEVEFSGDEQTWLKTFSVSSAQNLKNQIRNEITRLNELSAFSKILPDGAYDVTEEAPIAPTQAEVEKNDWFRDFGRLERVQKLIELGVLTGLEAPVAALRKRVKDDFKAVYVADM